MILPSYLSAVKLINQYGQAVTLVENGETKTAKAFIQPLRHGDKRTISGSYTETFIDNSEQFLYIGVPDLRLDILPVDTTTISSNGDSYILKKADKICVSDDIIYIRAILSKE